MTRIQTKRVSDPAGAGDGARVLVMRLWPRGVRKGAVTVWLKELGPSYELLKGYKTGRVSWPEFRRRYLAGLKLPPAQRALEELLRIVSRRPVTLLCACERESRCHRALLRQKLAADQAVL